MAMPVAECQHTRQRPQSGTPSKLSCSANICAYRPCIRMPITVSIRRKTGIHIWTRGRKSFHKNCRFLCRRLAEPCIKFLKRQAAALDLAIAVHYPSNAQNPLIVITWPGSEPTLPSILLNSHMDVVPVYPGQWTHPPFGAEMDADGRIFGRGAQDDKPLGTQYLAAIRALKRDGVQRLKRTIHVVYAPDEETGSEHGWSAFVETNEFKAMNAGFLLDEGIGSETAQLDVYYAERKSVKMYVNCTGASGHGLYILPNTAAQKALFMANKLYRLRDSEEQRLRRNASLTIGEVTTINLTVLKGGLLSNVIPGEVMLVFGVRLAIDVPLDYFRAMVWRNRSFLVHISSHFST